MVAMAACILVDCYHHVENVHIRFQLELSDR